MQPATISDHSELDGLDFRFRGRCVHPDGAVDLARYPHLTYAPLQWGEGVRTASSGILTAKVAAIALSDGLVQGLDRNAADLGITFDELLDALRFVRAQGKI